MCIGYAPMGPDPLKLARVGMASFGKVKLCLD